MHNNTDTASSELPSFHICSPLLESLSLEKLLQEQSSAKCKVWLKMDSSQPSGSFKIRGMGLAVARAVLQRNKTKIVCSSGGNAGKAVAYACRMLNVPVQIIVPLSTSTFMRGLIEDEGAEVTVHGVVWNEADELARSMADSDESLCYMPPFDLPDIWEGHASIVHEISSQLPSGRKPSCIITVCGGGGLLCGIAKGCHDIGWDDIPIVVAETHGAHSFNASVVADELVSLDDITSVAKTLGAKTVAEEAFNWTKKHKIHSVVVSDREAVLACERFANEHRVLVEPSCGAGLAVLYSNKLSEIEGLCIDDMKDVVVVVCGGNAISLPILQHLLETCAES
eukprot:CAMPEP_0174266032 /NCGR_PEP_ID=MMETSP0439-20130205/28723_1 /TAXON_ID=0 /ORGANISM="Stereomyxa ramosa, Strain Chinc5" /LENGTH=338 /DNA_ID=CAMNT_0015352775 /DNA_START=77 /DNA_END=1093 /DNA_ORIENTATION=+